MRSDFQASLLERLNSLRRGSKGRMLDTRQSIPIEDLMNRPIVLELDSLNGDEKSLIMMFLLSFVYEYCKVHRKSGSPLKHMLLVEEAHNLIGASVGSEFRASPKAQTLELFVNMLAEMRALGQGILIADQLPTAIAPQAVKQTNVKVLMRITAKDDREEIGNTMDLNDEQMHQVVNFKTGHAYLYHEGEDRVRAIRMLNFKEEHTVEEPPSDDELRLVMSVYEQKHPELYLPFPECSSTCEFCNRRVRNQAESFLQNTLLNNIAGEDIYNQVFPGSASADVEMFRKTLGICGIMRLLTEKEAARLQNRYGDVGEVFGTCVYIHMKNKAKQQMDDCSKRQKQCDCSLEKQAEFESEIENKESNVEEANQKLEQAEQRLNRLQEAINALSGDSTIRQSLANNVDEARQEKDEAQQERNKLSNELGDVMGDLTDLQYTNEQSYQVLSELSSSGESVGEAMSVVQSRRDSIMSALGKAQHLRDLLGS